MKLRFAFLAVLSLILASCVDSSGLSAESSRPPRGNINSSVVVMEFGDLQCPACRAAVSKIVDPLLEKYGTDIRFEFHHFPLRTIHRFALDLAMAAECAADQGKFWEFEELAYAKQTDLKKDIWDDWAEKAGVAGMELFRRCVDSEIKRETVMADFEKGKALGVSGTPTFFVNGQKMDTDLEKISAAIDEALKGSMQRL